MSAASPRPTSSPWAVFQRISPVRASYIAVPGLLVAPLLVLVDAEDFEAGPRRVEVADVERVAVPQAGGEEPLAVVVDDHRPVDDLVLAVAVDVGDAEAVVPLAGEASG